MLIARKPDSALCFVCDECSWMCDRFDDLDNLAAGCDGHGLAFDIPSAGDIEAAGWEPYCEHSLLQRAPGEGPPIRLLALLTPVGLILDTVDACLPASWTRRRMGASLLLTKAAKWTLLQIEHELRWFGEAPGYARAVQELGPNRSCFLVWYDDDTFLAEVFGALHRLRFMCVDIERRVILSREEYRRSIAHWETPEGGGGRG